MVDEETVRVGADQDGMAVRDDCEGVVILRDVHNHLELPYHLDQLQLAPSPHQP
jgi:hypothetical protein